MAKLIPIDGTILAHVYTTVFQSRPYPVSNRGMWARKGPGGSAAAKGELTPYIGTP